jgi:TIR domain
MTRVEKTVFISYRRADEPWAVAVFGDLTHHGYDVFVDYDGIASGRFETVIFENIRARAHFLVLLTPTALERCGDPKDWMRREIEYALDNRRNIVPAMLKGFKFGTPAIATQLIGKLGALKEYNGLEIPEGYFPQAMERLRSRFLNVPVDAVLHPASDSAQQVAKEQKHKATMALEASRAAEQKDAVTVALGVQENKLANQERRAETRPHAVLAQDRQSNSFRAGDRTRPLERVLGGSHTGATDLEPLIEGDQWAIRFYRTFAALVFAVGIAVVAIAFNSTLEAESIPARAFGAVFLLCLSAIPFIQFLARRDRLGLMRQLRSQEAPSDDDVRRIRELVWEMYKKGTS